MTSSSVRVSGETAWLRPFLQEKILVEVVPAATLNSVLGFIPILFPDGLPLNYRQPSAGDSIFLASQAFGYQEYVHLNSTRLAKGWYAPGSPDLANNAVIYPDEAIIIAKEKVVHQLLISMWQIQTHLLVYTYLSMALLKQ